jgi:hypothetical protein
MQIIKSLLIETRIIKWISPKLKFIGIVVIVVGLLLLLLPTLHRVELVAVRDAGPSLHLVCIEVERHLLLLLLLHQLLLHLLLHLHHHKL